MASQDVQSLRAQCKVLQTMSTLPGVLRQALIEWAMAIGDELEDARASESNLAEMYEKHAKLAGDVMTWCAEGRAILSGPLHALAVETAQRLGVINQPIVLLPAAGGSPSSIPLRGALLIFDGATCSFGIEALTGSVCHEVAHAHPAFAQLEAEATEASQHAAEHLADLLATSAAGPAMARALAALVQKSNLPKARDTPTHPSATVRAAFLIEQTARFWSEDVRQHVERHLKPLVGPVPAYAETGLQKATQILSKLQNPSHPVLTETEMNAHKKAHMSGMPCVTIACLAMVPDA